MIKRLGHYLKFGATALAVSSAAHTAHAAQIDLLVLYDDFSASRMQGEPAIVLKSWQDQINTMYRNSQVDLQLRIVGVERNNFASSDMTQALTTIARSAAVAQIRDRVGADFVTQLHQSGNCGVGYLSVHPNYAFNVLGAGCGPARGGRRSPPHGGGHGRPGACNRPPTGRWSCRRGRRGSGRCA